MSLLARRDLLVAITLWMTGVACGGNSELSPGATVVATASSSSAVAPGPTSGAPGVALPDLPPDDGLIPIAQPARGATDYLQYREVCALASIAGYAAEVVGVPSEVQPKVEARKDGNSVLRLDVQKVVVAEAGVVVGSQVDVLVAARDGTRFKGSGVLGVWPGLKGSAVELLLSPSPDPAAPWYMRVAHEAPSGVQFVPNECNATHVFDEFARAAGRPNGLDLMRELHREEVKYEACFADSAGATDIGRCDGSVLLPIAEIAQFGNHRRTMLPSGGGTRIRRTDCLRSMR